MLQLISITLFALAGLSMTQAAPTGNSLMNSSPIDPIQSNTIPITWKRDHYQLDQQSTNVLTEEFIKTAIAQAMAHKSEMVKRGDDDDDKTFDLSAVFRGIFDRIVDYVIEVTPLNDIVHGNYDLLYEIFLSKVDELVSGITSGAPLVDPFAAPTNPLAPATPPTVANVTDATPTDSTATGATATGATAIGTPTNATDGTTTKAEDSVKKTTDKEENDDEEENDEDDEDNEDEYEEDNSEDDE